MLHTSTLSTTTLKYNKMKTYWMHNIVGNKESLNYVKLIREYIDGIEDKLGYFSIHSLNDTSVSITNWLEYWCFLLKALGLVMILIPSIFVWGSPWTQHWEPIFLHWIIDILTLYWSWYCRDDSWCRDVVESLMLAYQME